MPLVEPPHLSSSLEECMYEQNKSVLFENSTLYQLIGINNLPFTLFSG